MAVAVGAPHLGQRLPHQLRGAHRGPRGAADRRHVSLTGEHRIHRVEFAATGVAVLADVGVEADHLQVRLGDARPAQIIERQDGRVRRVGGPERKALSGNVFSAVQIAAGMCNEHGGVVDVGIALGQWRAPPAGLQHGPHVGQVGVPGDVDVAGDQRIDQPRVVGVEHEIHLGVRAFGVLEVAADAFPNRDHVGCVCDCSHDERFG
ncbi:Uncharacterised protein [Mycobacterium tuberculosis]|nr:Uncharacterised protein [Mycobacterium tuberculosis]